MNDYSEHLKREMKDVNGFLGAAIVDSDSGMFLGICGENGDIDVEMEAAANVEVMLAKYRVLEALNLEASVEDVLITLGRQYHVLRPVHCKPSVLIYAALDKRAANLALARMKIRDFENNLEDLSQVISPRT
jgi:predicted regulator of Ras-like GTPase activity (Roadblock/LC7/MglB family)